MHWEIMLTMWVCNHNHDLSNVLTSIAIEPACEAVSQVGQKAVVTNGRTGTDRYAQIDIQHL